MNAKIHNFSIKLDVLDRTKFHIHGFKFWKALRAHKSWTVCRCADSLSVKFRSDGRNSRVVDFRRLELLAFGILVFL